MSTSLEQKIAEVMRSAQNHLNNGAGPAPASNKPEASPAPSPAPIHERMDSTPVEPRESIVGSSEIESSEPVVDMDDDDGQINDDSAVSMQMSTNGASSSSGGGSRRLSRPAFDDEPASQITEIRPERTHKVNQIDANEASAAKRRGGLKKPAAKHVTPVKQVLK